MGMIDKELIESKYGQLWSQETSLVIGEKPFTLKDLKIAFGFVAADIVAIDALVMGEKLFAFRYYDGDDRCVTVLEFDETFHVVEEHRAHIADWLGDTYYDSGIKAFIPEEMVNFLRECVEDREDQ